MGNKEYMLIIIELEKSRLNREKSLILFDKALLLYFFLVLVGDRHGVSYYSDRSMEQHLKLNSAPLQEARVLLVEEGLIAYVSPLYQVLSLPVPWGPTRKTNAASSHDGPVSFAEILKTLSKPKEDASHED